MKFNTKRLSLLFKRISEEVEMDEMSRLLVDEYSKAILRVDGLTQGQLARLMDHFQYAKLDMLYAACMALLRTKSLNDEHIEEYISIAKEYAMVPSSVTK